MVRVSRELPVECSDLFAQIRCRAHSSAFPLSSCAPTCSERVEPSRLRLLARHQLSAEALRPCKMPTVGPVRQLRTAGDFHGADEYASRQVARMLVYSSKAAGVAWPQGGIDVDALSDMTRSASELVLLRATKNLLRVWLPNAECSFRSVHLTRFDSLNASSPGLCKEFVSLRFTKCAELRDVRPRRFGSRSARIQAPEQLPGQFARRSAGLRS